MVKKSGKRCLDSHCFTFCLMPSAEIMSGLCPVHHRGDVAICRGSRVQFAGYVQGDFRLILMQRAGCRHSWHVRL